MLIWELNTGDLQLNSACIRNPHIHILVLSAQTTIKAIHFKIPKATRKEEKGVTVKNPLQHTLDLVGHTLHP